ncbi:MAG: hypothetical protein Q8O67_24185 [Deltaproteobacteria bacterium]|nr:hypothetical protein [Deltaproteobacteria bacterium]
MTPAGRAEAAKAAAVDVGNALAGCLRVAAFYDPDHPVARQRRNELEVLVQAWHAALGTDGVVAAAGETLLLSGLEEGLANDSARAFCTALVQKSVFALRLRAPTTAKDLADLFGLLGEADSRIRAAGGVARMYLERGPRAVDVMEMDLDKLLSGVPIDRSNLDPLASKALSEILALKSRLNRRGSAVALTLERVTTPLSLGSVLDELIDGAAPGVAVGPPKTLRGAKGPLHGLNADELAEIGGDAFEKVAGQQGSSPEVLAEAARALSAALVRLSPEARFKLLHKIAGGANEKSAEAVGREVTNPVLLQAVVQVVMGGERDSKLAHAVGNLLERMRPIERDRHKFISELDEAARVSGRPLEGMFLQELNESAQKTSFGSLDLPIRETRAALVEVARLRRRGTQPEIILKTFASLREEDRLERTARLVCHLMGEERVVVAATLTTVRGLLATPPTDPTMAETGGAVISALWWRAIRDGPASPAATHLTEVARSPTGADWFIALMAELRGQRGPDLAALLVDLLRIVSSVHQSESFRRRLVDALHALDLGVLRQIERRVADLPLTAAQAIILRAGKDSSASALILAQLALKAHSVDVKEGALRALAPVVDDGVIAFLRRAAGADSDADSQQLLLLTKDDAAGLFRLQRTAIEALGACKSGLAVPALDELLNRTRLVGGGELDRLRPFVGRALGINGTREARACLDNGRRSKSKPVRLACGGTT